MVCFFILAIPDEAVDAHWSMDEHGSLRPCGVSYLQNVNDIQGTMIKQVLMPLVLLSLNHNATWFSGVQTNLFSRLAWLKVPQMKQSRANIFSLWADAILHFSPMRMGPYQIPVKSCCRHASCIIILRLIEFWKPDHAVFGHILPFP